MEADHIADAAFRGDLDAVKEMIRLGADADGKNSRGYSPLHNAIENCDLAMARLLLEAGADPNLEDVKGWTPLYHTIEAEADAASQLELPVPPTQILELLLTHGADPNQPSSRAAMPQPRRRTPLQLARSLQHKQAERLLLAAGASE